MSAGLSFCRGVKSGGYSFLALQYARYQSSGLSVYTAVSAMPVNDRQRSVCYCGWPPPCIDGLVGWSVWLSSQSCLACDHANVYIVRDTRQHVR